MIPASDIPHVSTCQCGACHPLSPALWSVYATLLEHDEYEGLLAMKADKDPSIYEDPFIALELQLAALLASRYGVAALQAQRVLEKALTPPLVAKEVDEALAEAEILLGDVFDDEIEREVRRLVNRIITRGALIGEGVDPDDIETVEPEIPLEPERLSDKPEDEDGVTALEIGAAVIGGGIVGALLARGTSLEGVPSVTSLFEGIVSAAKYHTNNHFNRIILPEIQSRVALILNGADPADVPGFDDINRYLSRRLQNVPYWRIVANGAASRAYHYGVMKAGALRQFRGYEIVAVLDERTSDICRSINGTQFFLNNTVDLLEKAVQTDDPEQLKDILPWVPKAEDVEGKSADELRDLGYVVPPFHPNCRSTIKFI